MYKNGLLDSISVYKYSDEYDLELPEEIIARRKIAHNLINEIFKIRL